MKNNYVKPQLKVENIEIEEIFAISLTNTFNPNNILNWDDGLWE